MDKINVFNILKIQKHKYFDDNYVNNQLKLKTQLLMVNAFLHKGNETLLLMNNKTFKYTIYSENDQNSVSFNSKMLSLLMDKTNLYTAIHNHPNESSFSIDDLIQLLRHEQLILLILCTNSCKYCAGLLKSNTVDNITSDKMLKYIKQYMYKNNLTGHSSAIPLIEYFSTRKLIYVYYINY